MKRLSWQDCGYHIEEIFEIHICPTCDCCWGISDSNYNSEVCGECKRAWVEELLPGDTRTPKGKASARWIANARYPVSRKCSVDGCKKRGERHHFDYNKPTEIIWLCRKHHVELHRQLKHLRYNREEKSNGSHRAKFNSRSTSLYKSMKLW